MCAIGGIAVLRPGSAPPDRDAVVSMAVAQEHRGPDGFGIYRDERVGLAHARLAIVDVAGGAQPLSDSTDSVWIVFNGEVFNFVELRDELAARGHVFRTRSDTEVIVHAWKEWGDAAFERFNGQWAVAIWDAAGRRLVLARDPIGICPLHIGEHDGILYFASEMKAILAACPSMPRVLDPLGIAQTLTFWSIVPPQGVFQGIGELEPGHLRTYDLRGDEVVVAERALSFPGPSPDPGDRFTGSHDEAVAAVRDAIDTATQLRVLRADVPVGSYLSGGLDSSLVAALGRRVAGDRFETFSLRFDDAEYDETTFQRTMARRLGSNHHEVEVSRSDIAEVFPDVVRHAERPILRTAPAPLLLLSRLVHRHGTKVVLTGEGADEMFAGYDLFREGKVRRFWARDPQSTIRPRLLERLYPYLSRSPVAQQAIMRQFFGRGIETPDRPGFAHDTRWHTTAALQRLLTQGMRDAIQGHDVVAEFLATLDPAFPAWDALAQDQHIEIRTLLAGYLMASQGDRMLLASSVEGRFPFLDRDVIALAHSLPADIKLRVLDEKHVVKRAADGLVPDEIRARQKQPYRAPDAISFVGPEAPAWVGDVTSDDALVATGVFEPAAVHQLLGKCRARAAAGQFSNTDNMAVVAVLSTQLLGGFVRTHHLEGPRRSVRLAVDVDRVREPPRGAHERSGLR